MSSKSTLLLPNAHVDKVEFFKKLLPKFSFFLNYQQFFCVRIFFWILFLKMIRTWKNWKEKFQRKCWIGHGLQNEFSTKWSVIEGVSERSKEISSFEKWCLKGRFMEWLSHLETSDALQSKHWFLCGHNSTLTDNSIIRHSVLFLLR